MKLLEGKTALVTGGSRGIGAAIVKKFAEHGADVAFTYLSSEERANKIVEELKALGSNAKAYRSDASSFTEAETLVKSVLEDYGKIDVLVNNAGITRDNLMFRMTEEAWDMSSVVGVFGNAGQANYAASKAGIFGFTKSIAKEMGSRNVRCNAIAPGFIETDMTQELDDKTKEAFLTGIPLKRLGQGSEVADACLFLASDMSSYVSGQTISICGALNC